MPQRELHLIFNPAANRGRVVTRRKIISSFLDAHSEVEPIWHVTEAPGHASRIVEALPEEVLVAAVGGDGTVHEVAAACVGTQRTLGVLPVGSGNCYVKALGVGTSLRRALEILVRWKIRVVDAGEVNGVLFNDGLGIGFDAEVAARVARAPRYLGGFGRYLWSVLQLLPGFQCREVTLKLDNREAIESKTVLVAVALGTTYGGRFKLAPTSRLDDGLFDVLWSEELGRAEAAPTDVGLDYREVKIQSTDGLELASWWVPGDDASRAVVLVSGIEGDKSDRHVVKTTSVYAGAGYAVLMIDLRAQGRSEGQRVTMGYKEVRDVRGALLWLDRVATKRYNQLPVDYPISSGREAYLEETR
jgi:diacylglycerol kinase (ATP)